MQKRVADVPPSFEQYTWLGKLFFLFTALTNPGGLHAVAAVAEGEVRKRKARETALLEAAKIAREGCLVPPDGGDPTEADVEMCDRIAARILDAI